MAHLATPSFTIEWPDAAKVKGTVRSVRELLASEAFFLAYAGSVSEGWAVYLVENETRKTQQVSPLFHRDYGDTRQHMIDAVIRAYGVENNPCMNLGREHPEEAFIWPTYGRGVYGVAA